MEDSVISSVYPDSGEPVKVGDRVSIDGHPATVTGVFLPDTSEAADCYCEDTGALSVLYDDGVSVIIPFGHYHELVRRA